MKLKPNKALSNLMKSKIEQMPLTCKWEKMTETCINTFIINEQKFIDDVSWEFANTIDKKVYQNFIDVFDKVEEKRIEKMKLFLEQTK